VSAWSRDSSQARRKEGAFEGHWRAPRRGVPARNNRTPAAYRANAPV
jgi:hypothetical protein